MAISIQRGLEWRYCLLLFLVWMLRWLISRFSLMYFFTCVVGVGSAFFHGTLLYAGQVNFVVNVCIIAQWLDVRWNSDDVVYYVLGIYYHPHSRRWNREYLFDPVGHFIRSGLLRDPLSRFVGGILVRFFLLLGAYVTAFQIHFAVLCIWTLQKLTRLSYEKPSIEETKQFPHIALFMIIASFSFWVCVLHFQ
jgi:hypothetical protein